MNRVLLIDDVEQLGPPLAMYFKRFDLVLEQAFTPSKGLARLQEGNFDAAILDIMLLYGFHAEMARLRQAPASFKSLYVDRPRDDNRVRDLLKLAQQPAVQVTRVEAGGVACADGARQWCASVAVVPAAGYGMDARRELRMPGQK